MKKYIFVGIALLLISSLALAVSMPKYITVQGRLSDVNDVPLDSGSYLFNFSVYNSTGKTIWNEIQNTYVDNGIFNAELGRNTTGGINLPFDQDYFLEVSIWNQTINNWQVFAPRFNVTSSAFTFSAGRLLPTTYPIDTTSDVNASRFCIDSDCRTSWPSGGFILRYMTGGTLINNVKECQWAECNVLLQYTGPAGGSCYSINPRQITLNCPNNWGIMSGGGHCQNGLLTVSRPVGSGGATAWQADCEAGGVGGTVGEVNALCCH
jgi:hypothetical protein